MWNWVCPKKRTVCFCSIFSCSDIRELGGPVDKGHFCSDVSIWKRPAAHMYARISDVSWLIYWGRRSKPSLSSHLIKHQKRELKMKKKFWMKHLEQPNSTETTSSTKGRKERKREEKKKKKQLTHRHQFSVRVSHLADVASEIKDNQPASQINFLPFMRKNWKKKGSFWPGKNKREKWVRFRSLGQSVRLPSPFKEGQLFELGASYLLRDRQTTT